MMMVVYMNVCNGFVPQGCLSMQITAVGLLTMKKYKYSMDISAVHAGVLPEIVLCSAKRLIEFLKGHIRAGDQKTTLWGALKSWLPKCMLSRLGRVSYPNVQKDFRLKGLIDKCKQEQDTTMVRLTR